MFNAIDPSQSVLPGNSSRIFLCLVLCGSAFGLFSGCGGKKGPPPLKAYAVKGTLTLDGQPFGPIILLLQSTATSGSGPMIRGEADEKGNLKFTTHRIGDGAPAGEYKLYFPPDPLGRAMKPIPSGYRNLHQSPFTVKIEEKKNELNINLDSKYEFVDPDLGPMKKDKNKKKDDKKDKPEDAYKGPKINPDLLK